MICAQLKNRGVYKNGKASRINYPNFFKALKYVEVTLDEELNG